jgi:hypothetical protein
VDSTRIGIHHLLQPGAPQRGAGRHGRVTRGEHGTNMRFNCGRRGAPYRA